MFLTAEAYLKPKHQINHDESFFEVFKFREIYPMLRKKISERAVEFILTRQYNDLKNLTLKKVAKNIGVNRLLLYLNFIVDLRTTLPNYILKHKIHEAFFILTKDELKSVNELSGELGFLTVEDFCFEFEKYYAIDPEKFKQLGN